MSANRKEINYAIEKWDVHWMLKQFKQNTHWKRQKNVLVVESQTFDLIFNNFENLLYF